MRHDPMLAILADLMRRVDGLAGQRGHLSVVRLHDEVDQIRHIARAFHLDVVEGLAGTLESALSLHGLGPVVLSYLDLMRDAISSDMRALLASDALRARLAVDFYAYRAAQEIGKLAVTLGGLDALVFTAGIGANSPQVRARICAQLTGLFGIVIDEAANNANRQLVSHANSRVPVWALQTDEEGMIALSTARILRDNGGL